MGITAQREDITEQLHADERRITAAGMIDPATRGGSASGRPVPLDPGPTALAGGTERAATDYTGWVEECICNFARWDRDGYVWGRPGHYPLWVWLGPHRMQSADGQAERKAARRKVDQWREGAPWPWWDYHESERFFWLHGAPSSGRGYSGILDGPLPLFDLVMWVSPCVEIWEWGCGAL